MPLDDKTKQHMESGLEHAVRVVQTRFTQFEQRIFVPCLETSLRFVERRPVIAILISIFSLLSFLPVASFMGFAILVVASFAFLGLGAAFIASTVLIVAAGTVLIFVLSSLLLASIFFTGVIVSLFISFRLIQQLPSRISFKEGFLGWAHETRGRLKWPVAEFKSSPITNGDHMKKEPNAPSSSDEWHQISDQGKQT